MEAFLSLDEFDLKDLGINHDQSRKQILAAITKLNSNKVRFLSYLYICTV